MPETCYRFICIAGLFRRAMAVPGRGWFPRAEETSSQGGARTARSFLLRKNGKLMAADIQLEPAFQSGAPHALFASPGGFFSVTQFRWELARDGKRFLLVSPAFGAVPEPATVVLNWQSGLKK